MGRQLYLWEEFDQYMRQDAPDKRVKASNWQTAMGLQAVDGLQPSDYLVEAARRNIEGEIDMDEVHSLITSYYESKTHHAADDNSAEEADRASANIARILSTRTLDFTTNGYINVHRRIFEGVFKHAGRLRDYDISKKEWVLRGDSVSYLGYQDLRRAIDYDLQQEREFNYRGLTMVDKVKRIARFVAGLWQIHAFAEGNTRTTAVFLIQYLRSIGFDVDNDMFARHSWYFRNALVRANYKNVRLDIDYDHSFLEAFLRNLLMGEHNELHNRHMLVNPPSEWNVPDVPDVPENVPEKRQKMILELVTGNSHIKVIEIAQQLNVSDKTIKRDIAVLKGQGKLERVGSERSGHWRVL